MSMLTLFIVDNIKDVNYISIYLGLEIVLSLIGPTVRVFTHFFFHFCILVFFWLFTMEHTTKNGGIKSIATYILTRRAYQDNS